MDDEALWKRRFLVFAAVRLSGMLLVGLGLAVAFTDLIRPGGANYIGAALIALGTIEIALGPVLLKRMWDRP